MTCDHCDGNGYVTCPGCRGKYANCARCNGDGAVMCPACDGVRAVQDVLESLPVDDATWDEIAQEPYG